MKQHLNKIWGGAVILAMLALFAGLSFDKSASNTYVYEDENGVVHEYDYAPPKSYQKSFALDTITGTTRDTIAIPWILASPWQYEYYVKLRKLSGTPNTKILLQARTVTNGIWSPVDSVSCSGADSTKVHFRLRGEVTYGAQHQLIFIRSGSHSLARNVQVNIKPPNQ